MAFAFAELLNQEALALEADGVDIVQFDEPAFNVYMADAAEWGVAALERAAQGLKCKTAVHICYGYGIKANVDWKGTLGDEWRQYEQVFPALAKSSIDQVSLECFHSHVPPELMRLLDGKDVMVGVIDVASDVIETPEEIAETIATALRSSCRRSACSRAPTAAWRRCGARSPRPSWPRWRRARPWRARATADERCRAAGADDAAREARDGAARARPRRSRAGRLRPLRAQPRSPSSTRSGRRGTSCRPTPTCATAAATGAAAMPASSSTRPTVRLVAQRAHWQPVEYNALHGGLERWFEPIDPAVLAAAAWQRMLQSFAAMASQLKGAQPWFVEAHQFRIDTTDGIGRPTPEGAHRDGVDFVAVVLVGREGIKGGETRVFATDRPEGMRFTMLEPWTTLVLDDARVIHESTPIQPLEGYGHRDTLVLTYRAGAFQGPPVAA